MAIASRRDHVSTRRAIRRAVRRQTNPAGIRRRSVLRQKLANCEQPSPAFGSDDIGVALSLVGRPASVATQYCAKLQLERRQRLYVAVAGLAWFAITLGFAAICLFVFT